MSFKSNLDTPERREHLRHNCKANIEWAYFNSAKYFDGKLLNFSRGGVYMETVHDITPGSTIIIRLGKVFSGKSESADHEYPRLVSLGEVTWHLKLWRRHRDCFGAGVRYPITA